MWSILNITFYVGSSINGFSIDNCNIGFILLILLLFPIVYWIAGFESKTSSLSFLLLLLFILLFGSFVFKSIWLLFLVYELIIIILVLVLWIFLPTFYKIRTSFFFYVFTIVGTISFSISILLIISFEFLFCVIIIVPFIIKLPCFPVFYWLPEVHCESNTSISLLLAGIILKLSLFGLMRFIISSFFLSLRLLSSFIVSFTLVGIIIAFSSCFRYFDLKKIIAFSSILHLNFSLVSLLSMNSSSILSGMIISLSHGISSMSLFLIVGLIINKTYTRYLDSFYFISLQLRGMLLFFLLSNLSFPGTLNFIAEILCLIAIVSVDYFFIIFFLFSTFFSTFFWFFILNRKLPYFINSLTLNTIHSLVLNWLLIISVVMYLLIVTSIQWLPLNIGNQWFIMYLIQINGLCWILESCTLLFVFFHCFELIRSLFYYICLISSFIFNLIYESSLLFFLLIFSNWFEFSLLLLLYNIELMSHFSCCIDIILRLKCRLDIECISHLFLVL